MNSKMLRDLRILMDAALAQLDEEYETFEGIADAIGCCTATVRKLWYHETKEPRYSTIAKILRAVNWYDQNIKFLHGLASRKKRRSQQKAA